MSRSAESKSVSIWSALVGVISAALASGAGLLSGGLSLGVAGLMTLGPALVWLLWGRRAAVGAVLAAALGLAGLLVMQNGEILPNPMFDSESLWLWALAGLPVLYVLSVVSRLLRHTTNTTLDTSSDQARPAADGERSRLPWLIVDISPFGRIRRLEGAVDLVPGAVVGAIADRVLLDEAGLCLIAGRKKLKNGTPVLIVQSETASGRALLILPEGQIGSDPEQNAAQTLRERTDFFAGLGHDLKSPLNAVIGFAEMMETEIQGPMPEPYKDYPGLIRESGQTLLRLVEDMLGYAKSEAGTYEIDPAPMDITASGEAVMRQSQADAARAEVRLELKSSGQVLALADAGAVQRIWDNLVSNAIKYSAPGSVVTLTSRLRGGETVLSVTDRGAGMDADDLERIAKPFEQGRNARGRAGTGLGLAMVKRLADMHGGKLIIRTAPGEGTQVTVTLPAATDKGQKAAE